MGAMLLLSSLLVLRVQQDRYAEAVRWHGGVPDHGPPFPWESESLIGRGDGFEATFLAPVVRRASTFVRHATAEADGAFFVTGLSHAAAMGGDGLPGLSTAAEDRPGHGTPNCAGISGIGRIAAHLSF